MNYLEQYNSKLTTADELAKHFKNGWIVGTDAGPTHPDAMINALCERAKVDPVSNIKLHMMLDIYPFEFLLNPEYNKKINVISWFASSGARKAINGGYGEFIPNYYRDIPKLLRQYYEFDAYIVSVSPMDENGNFSLATTCSYSEAMIEKSKKIFIEVNEHQPRALNNTQIHIDKVDAIIENNHPLPVIPYTPLSENSITIGNLIAEQISDGACIQLGIGGIPDAVGNALKTKKDLGIHTEMFTDSMVELIKCGAVNNSKKQIHIGKTVTTFAYGSQRIYDFINNNPEIEILPVDYVNDPNVICQNNNFVSINSAIEVDFWGQVCSESIGTKHMSGSGGQVDYVRGACQSKGGKSFIAFESSTKGLSKIKSTLAEGAVVTTSKNDVDYIVTEYGLAHLRGEPLSSRAKQLISIAHPDFRDELTFEAKKRGIII